MNHCGTQRLKTKRLVLRRLTESDAEPMFRNWASDPEVTKYMTWPAHSSAEISRMVLESWVRDYSRPDFYQWAIELDGEPIGSISVVEINEAANWVEIGYCIGKNWWHKGIMTEALNAVMKFFFEEVGANRVSAVHDPNNPHSGGVMRKCGMKYEGTNRGSARNNQGVCDTAQYAILRSDWKK